MIPESALDAALARLDDEAAVEAAAVALAREQTPYLQYLRTEGFDLLTADERDYLLYLALVVYAACGEHLGEAGVPTLDGDRVEAWDERCWGWMEAASNRPMRERLDAFFAAIDQEELLAFAEDSLVDPERDDDDDGPGGVGAALFVSAASRELGLVALATLIGAIDERLG